MAKEKGSNPVTACEAESNFIKDILAKGSLCFRTTDTRGGLLKRDIAIKESAQDCNRISTEFVLRHADCKAELRNQKNDGGIGGRY